MIGSIQHKGLRLYYTEGDGSRLPQEQLSKINMIFTALDAVSSEKDIRALGRGIHKLSGDMRDFWALKVTGNYRIVFRFEDDEVLDVDYLDYH